MCGCIYIMWIYAELFICNSGFVYKKFQGKLLEKLSACVAVAFQDVFAEAVRHVFAVDFRHVLAVAFRHNIRSNGEINHPTCVRKYKHFER